MDTDSKIASNPKASFSEYYNLYSPKPYIQALLKDKGYTLPFDAMQLVRRHLNQLNHSKNLNTLFLGSGHGTEVAALKYGYAREEILRYWLDDDPLKHHFSGGDSKLNITMVDINKAPLMFAHDVGLCDRFYVCDLTNFWPEELIASLKDETDLLFCVGATSYIGVDGFKYLVKLVEESNIKYFYFSLASFICSSFLEVLGSSSLYLQKLGDVRQRDYKNDEERLKITEKLNLRNNYSDDYDGLTASMYFASPTA